MRTGSNDLNLPTGSWMFPEFRGASTIRAHACPQYRACKIRSYQIGISGAAARAPRHTGILRTSRKFTEVRRNRSPVARIPDQTTCCRKVPKYHWAASRSPQCTLTVERQRPGPLTGCDTPDVFAMVFPVTGTVRSVPRTPSTTRRP